MFLIDIEVSPKNKNFSNIDNKYLVGKSKEDSKVFNVLIYARYDVEEAVIPPQIEIIKQKSFGNHEKLKSIIFPENSKLNYIESSAFGLSSLSKLVLPASIEQFHFQAFSDIKHLNEIEVSPQNQTFSIINKTFLVRKSEPTNKVPDRIVFCRRDVECVEIPSYIKEIGSYAFQYCTKLNSLKFERNSTLEIIDYDAFGYNTQLKNIVLPPSAKIIGLGAFGDDFNLESIEFLGDQITLEQGCFCRCNKLSVVSFPNATKIEFSAYSMSCISKYTIFKIRKDAEKTGDGLSEIEDQIKYFEEEKKTEKIKEPATTNKSIRFSKEKGGSNNKNQLKESPSIQKCMKHIRFLENRLSRYEEVIPFDPNMNDDQEGDDEDYEAPKDEFEEKDKFKGKEKSIFIDEEDESYHKIVCQIGEGATSVAYKVIDERNGEQMCKKVLKAEEGATTFKDFQNIYKEFEVLQQLSHPSICKSIGMNPQEEVKTEKKSSKEEFAQYEEDDEEEEFKIKSNKKSSSSSKENKKKTTIAIFLKYHPMNLKECLERDILSNTLKAKLVVEIAFGMLHIHDNGMIHRDLKLENVMVNYIFEAQLIDFGLAHVNEMKSTMTSMTKGIGTLAYMSPEMANEEEYDNKTDVYSFYSYEIDLSTF